MLIASRALFYFFVFELSAHADVVKHVLLERSTPESAQMQSACATLINQTSHFCNAGLFGPTEREGFNLDLLFKAEKKAYEVADNLLFKSLDQKYLESLFKDHDFLLYSGTARIEVLYKYFSLSYTPIHAIAALKVANPSLPELAFTGVKQSVYRLTSGYAYKDVGPLKEFGVGASVFHYSRTIVHADTNILEIAVEPLEKIVKKKDEHGFDADVGAALKPHNAYLPDVGILVENVASEQPTNTERLDIVPYLRRKSSIGLGYTLEHETGKYHLGLNLPFWGLYERFDRLSTSVALAYTVAYLQAFTSFSPYANSFGFLFSSLFYKVGIQYSNEKQHNVVQLKRKNNVNLFVSIFI
jgi:hypothetical protein